MIDRMKDFLERGARVRFSTDMADVVPIKGAQDEELTTLRGSAAQPGPGDIGRLRRERKRLLRAREQSIRDLGGLALEMVRRDDFRQDVLRRRAADVLGLEASARDVEEALDAAGQSSPSRSTRASAQCICGEQNEESARSCSACGRTLASEGGANPCPDCGASREVDDRFCASCRAKTRSDHKSATGTGW